MVHLRGSFWSPGLGDTGQFSIDLVQYVARWAPGNTNARGARKWRAAKSPPTRTAHSNVALSLGNAHIMDQPCQDIVCRSRWYLGVGATVCGVCARTPLPSCTRARQRMRRLRRVFQPRPELMKAPLGFGPPSLDPDMIQQQSLRGGGHRASIKRLICA